jgi:hypothetical protein
MKEQVFSFSRSETLYFGSDSQIPICNIEPAVTCITTKFYANAFNQATGHVVPFIFKGNWIDRQGAIYIGEPKQGGIPIAYVSRQLDCSVIFSSDVFYLTVAAGVDVAFVTMLIVALDNIHDRRNKCFFRAISQPKPFEDGPIGLAVGEWRRSSTPTCCH